MLVIDLLDIIVTKVDMDSAACKDDILVYPSEKEPYCCLKPPGTCVCKVEKYRVRPYAYNFFHALEPFFEFAIYSVLKKHKLKQIVKKLNTILNKDQQALLDKPQNRHQIARTPTIKNFFHKVLSEKHFMDIDGVKIENLYILSKSKCKENVILLSCNPLRMRTIQSLGFLVIPVVPFDKLIKKDY
jgi:hypothetical protein